MLTKYVSHEMADVIETKDAAAKAMGRLVGRYVIAEGHLFRIDRVGPQFVSLSIVGRTPRGGGRQFKMRVAAVQALLYYRDTPEDTWWATQPVGSIVHYTDSDLLVRCTVQATNGHYATLLPIALVGAGWEPLFEPSAGYNSTVLDMARRITEGKTLPSSARGIVEYRYDGRGTDPGALAPIAQERLVALLAADQARIEAKRAASEEARRKIRTLDIQAFKPAQPLSIPGFGIIGGANGCDLNDPAANMWEVWLTLNGDIKRTRYASLKAARTKARALSKAHGIEIS